jgi:hypothetical protein
MIINCNEPEGNAFNIAAAVVRHLRDQKVPEEAIDEFRRHMMASASYWELLDAATTITEGEITFINIPKVQ